MKLLALDTSTSACSVALYVDGCVQELFDVVDRTHTQRILPMIDELLADAQISLNQLDALAFGQGPGSFTGLRIACGVVQGLAFGLNLPVVGVSTLAAMAQRALPDWAFVALDARMGEIFWGVYQKSAQGFMVLSGDESVVSPEQIVFPLERALGIGSGWRVHGETLHTRVGELVYEVVSDTLPHASEIARLGVLGFSQGLAVSAQHVEPIYLRNKVARTEKERVQDKLYVPA